MPIATGCCLSSRNCPHAARVKPVLICLDDRHWADAGTTEALRSLPMRLAGAPIVWLIAYRAGQSSSRFMRAVQ